MKKFLCKIILYAFVIFIANLGFGEILLLHKDRMIKEKRFYPGVRWNEFYQTPTNTVDLIFLGSSHCYRSFDPRIIDRITGLNTFNMGSSEQTPTTGYFVLKEVLKYQNPKIIVMEIWLNEFYLENQIQNGGYNFDSMKWSLNKFAFLFQGFSSMESLELFFPTYRFRNLFTSDLIYTLMIRNSGAVNIDPSYKLKGYVENSETINKAQLNEKLPNRKFVPLSQNNNHLKYLKQIVALCRSKNIKPIWVSAPVTNTYRKKYNNYDNVYSYFKKIAEQFAINYIDYNQMRDIVSDHTDFYDHCHLNKNGAQKISLDIANKIKDML